MVRPLTIASLPETSCRRIQATVAKTTAHNKSSWYSDPAEAAVVTVPGPMNAAEITDQRMTLDRVLFRVTYTAVNGFMTIVINLGMFFAY